MYSNSTHLSHSDRGSRIINRMFIFTLLYLQKIKKGIKEDIEIKIKILKSIIIEIKIKILKSIIIDREEEHRTEGSDLSELTSWQPSLRPW